jgi:hypothetical protein
MSNLPTVIVFVAFCTVVGLILHHGLIGAAIALGLVLAATISQIINQ